MRAVCNTETFSKKLALVSRGVSAQVHDPVARGDTPGGWRRFREALGDGHGDLGPNLVAGGGRGGGEGRNTCPHLQRHRAVAAGGQLLARARRLGGHGTAGRGGKRVPHQGLRRRRLPAAARLRRGRGVQDVRGVARRDRREGVAVVLAGRDQAGFDGDPDQLRGEPGQDGNDGLLPPQHQGDGASDDRLRGVEGGDHTGAGHAGGLPHLRFRRRRRGRGVARPEPGAVQDRGRPFRDAAHRRELPGVPEAAADRVRARDLGASGRSSWAPCGASTSSPSARRRRSR